MYSTRTQIRSKNRRISSAILTANSVVVTWLVPKSSTRVPNLQRFEKSEMDRLFERSVVLVEEAYKQNEDLSNEEGFEQNWNSKNENLWSNKI